MRVAGVTVTGKKVGPDLAVLYGHFPPPYARTGALRADGALTVEGFGCDPWNPSRRPAEHPRGFPWAGLEIEFDGVVCHGDSGGALWQGGELVGILTAVRETAPEPTGYATGVRPGLPHSGQ